MIRFFSDKRTNNTKECLEISLGTKLKLCPKQDFKCAFKEGKIELKGKCEGELDSTCFGF
jgi:hypothetical protein